MAYSTSESYKELIYNEDTEQLLVIKINGVEINADYIRELNLKDDVFNDTQFSLGSAIKCQITISLDNDLVNELGSFDEMELSYKVKISDTEEEIVPLGNYIIKTIDNNSDLYTKYTMYDYMDKFEKAFDGSSYVPCTRFELLQHICNECGVELENTSIINGDVEVSVYDSTITAKQYLAYISERAGGFAKVIRNKLCIRSFGEVDTNVLPVEKAGEYVIDNPKTITKVIYENATQKFEQGNDDGYKVFLVQDNPFSCTQEEVDNIYNSIVGLTFQSLDIQIWGDPAIDTGDVIQIGDIKSFAQKEWKFSNGFYGKYLTPLEKEPTESNVSLVPTPTLIKRVQSRIDEESGKITLLSNELAEIDNTITEQNAQFELMNNQIESVVSSSETLNESIETLSTNMTQNNQSINASISEIKQSIEDGVSTIKNTMVTIDVEGIKVSTNLSAISTLITNNSFIIRNYDETLARFDNDGAFLDNLTVKNYFTAGVHRQEKYQDEETGKWRTGWFYDGGGM